MKMIYKIARTELQTLFYSPVAWLILIGFTIQAALSFTGLLGEYVDANVVGQDYGSGTLLYTRFGGIIETMMKSVYLYVPLLTMGIFSREFSSGSIKLLYSSPVTNWHIVLGKYFSMLLYGALMLLPVAGICIYGLFIIENLDFSVLLCGLLGIYLLFAAYAAIGVFMSSLTSYQVVAAIGTYAVLGLLNMVAGWWQQYDFIRDITYWLAMNNRSEALRYGLLNSEDILYYLIVVGLFLNLTLVRFNAARQKSRGITVLGRYLLVVIVTVLCGYITSRPAMKYYYDSTDNKAHTLTPGSQQIVENMTGGLTITTYANLIDDDFSLFGPMARNSDIARFEQYIRFKPEIKMKYVYYYDKCENPYLDSRYPNTSLREKMKKVAEIYKVDTTQVLTPAEMARIIDLGDEGYRCVRILERESGEKVRLRLFNDFNKHPMEPEISAAMKRISMPLPTIGFTTGHGERDIDGMGDRDYGAFVRARRERSALINQGFDVDTVSFAQPIPDKINIVLISDIKTAFTPEELVNYNAYIERGGNLFILSEPRRRTMMNELGAPLGIEILDGCVVKPDPKWQADLTLSHATRESAQISYVFDAMQAHDLVATMPTASALKVTPVGGFESKEVLLSETGSWIERQTTDFVDGIPQYDPATEQKGPLATAIALERTINGRTQKIMFVGDSDCITNGEMSASHGGLSSYNFGVIMGTVHWMSDNEVPIDIRRPYIYDHKIDLDRSGVKVVKAILIWIIPGLMLLFAIILWIRRRGR